MNPVERPPAIVRWTLRLEDTTALDAAVDAVEPAIRSVFGTGARAAVLRGDPLGHAVHPLLTDVVLGTWTSANLLDLCGGLGLPRPPSGSSELAFSPWGLQRGPDGRSGRQQGRATSGSVSCTLSPMLWQSACTPRRGLLAAVVDTAPGSGWRWRAQPSQESAATWAPTSLSDASRGVATSPTERVRLTRDARRPPHAGPGSQADPGAAQVDMRKSCTDRFRCVHGSSLSASRGYAGRRSR